MIKNLVFDFGGVIADIDRDNAVKAFRSVGLTDADTILDKYHQKGIFLEIEDGSIDADTFCLKLGELCHRSFTFEEARECWLGFFTDVPAYRLAYLENLRANYNIYILSNTNPFVMSWARSKGFTQAGNPLDYYVDNIYASYEIGSVKPDRKIFDFLISDSGLVPAESLFIDDGGANIKAGMELGFQTFQPVNGENWNSQLDAILK